MKEESKSTTKAKVKVKDIPPKKDAKGGRAVAKMHETLNKHGGSHNR